MTFDSVISIADIIQICSIILIIIGGICTYYKWRKSINLNQAGYINELNEKIREDEGILETIYMFDYRKNWYSPDFHGNMEMESKVDKTLIFFFIHMLSKKEKNN